MKKSELIAAISKNDKRPPKKDLEFMISSIASLLLDDIHVDSVKNNHLYDLDIERPSTSNRKIKTVYANVAIETMDTYIPEPLRNSDGTPIYRAINDVSTSDEKARTSVVGIFTPQQYSAKVDSFSSSSVGLKK